MPPFTEAFSCQGRPSIVRSYLELGRGRVEASLKPSRSLLPYQHLGLGCFCAMGEHISLILCPPVTNSWLNAWKNTTHKLEKVKWKVDLKMHSTESLVTKKLRGTGKQHPDPSPGTSECRIPQPASLVPLLIYFHLLLDVRQSRTGPERQQKKCQTTGHKVWRAVQIHVRTWWCSLCTRCCHRLFWGLFKVI